MSLKFKQVKVGDTVKIIDTHETKTLHPAPSRTIGETAVVTCTDARDKTIKLSNNWWYKARFLEIVQ